MTVQELIDKLSEMPREVIVVTQGEHDSRQLVEIRLTQIDSPAGTTVAVFVG